MTENAKMEAKVNLNDNMKDSEFNKTQLGYGVRIKEG